MHCKAPFVHFVYETQQMLSAFANRMDRHDPDHRYVPGLELHFVLEITPFENGSVYEGKSPHPGQPKSSFLFPVLKN